MYPGIYICVRTNGGVSFPGKQENGNDHLHVHFGNCTAYML